MTPTSAGGEQQNYISGGILMADIMETNPDNSPVCVDLRPVFHLD